MDILGRYLDPDRDERRQRKLREATRKVDHAEDKLLDGLGLSFGPVESSGGGEGKDGPTGRSGNDDKGGDEDVRDAQA